MAKLLNLSGNRFGHLVVSSKNKRIRGGGKSRLSYVVWLCKCDCGKDAWVKTFDLRRRTHPSCGCYSGTLIRNKKLLKPGRAAMRALYCEYVGAARRKNRQFHLTIEEFARLTRQNCHYCDVVPFAVRKSQSDSGDYVFNGIDRLDNAKGYTPTNCVACCWVCNNKKSNDNYEQFVDWINQVATNIKKRTLNV